MISTFFILLSIAVCKFFPLGIAVNHVKKVLEKNHASGVGKAIESMLTTGRLATSIPLDLPQVWTSLDNFFLSLYFLGADCLCLVSIKY